MPTDTAFPAIPKGTSTSFHYNTLNDPCPIYHPQAKLLQTYSFPQHPPNYFTTIYLRTTKHPPTKTFNTIIPL